MTVIPGLRLLLFTCSDCEHGTKFPLCYLYVLLCHNIDEIHVSCEPLCVRLSEGAWFLCHRCGVEKGQKLEDRWHTRRLRSAPSHTFSTPKGTEIYCATQMGIAAACHSRT